MLEAIIAGLLVVLALVLPIKWAFSLTLATSFSLFYYLISDIATAMFVILAIRVSAKYGLKEAFKNKLFKGHVLLFFFGAFSILWASSVAASLSILIAQVKVLIIAVVSLQIIQNRTDFKYVIFGMVGGLFYILVALTGWKFGMFGVSTSLYMNNISTYGRLLVQYFFPDRYVPINSNTWSALAALSVGIISIYLVYFRKTSALRVRLIVIGLVLVVTIVTLDLASRAGFIGLFAAILMVFFYMPPRKFYRYLIIVSVFLLTGSITVSLIAKLLPDSLEIIQSRLAQSEQEDPRLDIWETGLNMAINNPVIGVGIGNSSVEFKNYLTVKFSSDRLALHNSFLTHFAELGAVGLILFIRLIYLWQKPIINSKFGNALFVIVSFCILLNAFTHSFELENYFIAIIYVSHKFFLLEQRMNYPINSLKVKSCARVPRYDLEPRRSLGFGR